MKKKIYDTFPICQTENKFNGFFFIKADKELKSRRFSVDTILFIDPGLLDLFANAVRKEIDLSKNFSLKKPSLVEKLSRPLPQKTDTAVKSKDKEL